MNERGHRLALAHVREGGTEGGELRVAADEQRPLHGHRERFGRTSSQPCQNLLSLWALGGVSLQQIHAQPIELRRDIGQKLRGRAGSVRCFSIRISSGLPSCGKRPTSAGRASHPPRTSHTPS